MAALQNTTLRRPHHHKRYKRFDFYDYIQESVKSENDQAPQGQDDCAYSRDQIV